MWKEVDHAVDSLGLGLGQRFLHSIIQINQHLRSSDEFLSGVTRQQMILMYHIRSNERFNPKQLTERLGVKPSSITVMIDRLENMGYVRRTKDRTDRRVIRVELTSLGVEVLEEAIGEAYRIMDRLLTKLTEEEAARLIELLDKVTRG